MLSYQHSYHAGVFADVVKHVTLTRLLTYLTKKDKPLLYLDTHAGRGIYNLQGKHALKTGDANDGIKRLWPLQKELPDVFKPYIQAIKQLNEPGKLLYYPGSTQLALELLRPNDRLVSYELHSGEFDYLRQINTQGKRFFCENSDGLKALSSRLPPLERRGLIFIDPSYEIKSDYKQLAKEVSAGYSRFSQGVYCIWYPIIDKLFHGQLIRSLHEIAPTNHLQVEFYLKTTKQVGMNGCGLWIINPPYSLAAELTIVMKTLSKVFNPGESSYLIR